jgi:hypothetical protein
LTSDALGGSQEFRLGLAWWPVITVFNETYRRLTPYSPPNSVSSRVLLDIHP